MCNQLYRLDKIRDDITELGDVAISVETDVITIEQVKVTIHTTQCWNINCVQWTTFLISKITSQVWSPMWDYHHTLKQHLVILVSLERCDSHGYCSLKDFHSMNPIGVNSPWWDELSSKRSPPPGILSGLLYNATRICVRFFRNRCFINVLFAFLFVCLFYLCSGRWPSVAYKRHTRTCGHLNKLCWSWILHYNEEL